MHTQDEELLHDLSLSFPIAQGWLEIDCAIHVFVRDSHGRNPIYFSFLSLDKILDGKARNTPPFFNARSLSKFPVLSL